MPSPRVVVFQGKPALAELKLAAHGTVQGRVTDTSANRPVADLTVRLWSSTWNLIGAIRTDAEGTYRFEGVPAGPHLVTIDVPTGFVADTAERAILTGSRSRHDADFRLRTSGSIQGRVVDHAFGNPVADATVAAYDAAGKRLAHRRTGSDGAYSFDGLTGGPVTVRLDD